MGQRIVENGPVIACVILAFLCSFVPDANALKCKACTTPPKAAGTGITPCLPGTVEEDVTCTSPTNISCLFEEGSGFNFKGCARDAVVCQNTSAGPAGQCYCDKDFCNSGTDFTQCCSNQAGKAGNSGVPIGSGGPGGPGGPAGPGGSGVGSRLSVGTWPCLMTLASLVAKTVIVGVNAAGSFGC